MKKHLLLIIALLLLAAPAAAEWEDPWNAGKGFVDPWDNGKGFVDPWDKVDSSQAKPAAQEADKTPVVARTEPVVPQISTQAHNQQNPLAPGVPQMHTAQAPPAARNAPQPQPVPQQQSIKPDVNNIDTWPKQDNQAPAFLGQIRIDASEAVIASVFETLGKVKTYNSGFMVNFRGGNAVYQRKPDGNPLYFDLNVNDYEVLPTQLKLDIKAMEITQEISRFEHFSIRAEFDQQQRPTRIFYDFR